MPTKPQKANLNSLDSARKKCEQLRIALPEVCFDLGFKVFKLTRSNFRVFGKTSDTNTIADANPQRVICLDDGFKNNEQLKVNAVQTFQSRARQEENFLCLTK